MPIMRLKTDDDIYVIGNIIQIGHSPPVEIFDKNGKDLLVGSPGQHPRKKTFIPIDFKDKSKNDFRPKTYCRIKNGDKMSLVRIDDVAQKGIYVSMKRYLS